MGRALEVSGILFSPQIRHKLRGWSLDEWSSFPSLLGQNEGVICQTKES